MTPTPNAPLKGEDVALLDRLAEIISDAEITRVHANANFGAMSPREVVNDGVRKTAVGYHCGHTQFTILREHGLITQPRGLSHDADLTKKGKKYARVLYRVPATREEAPVEAGDWVAHVGDDYAVVMLPDETTDTASIQVNSDDETLAQRIADALNQRPQPAPASSDVGPWITGDQLHEIMQSFDDRADVSEIAEKINAAIRETAPDADKLKVAVEALERIEDLPASGHPEFNAAGIATRVLAHLKAEVGS